MAPTLDDTLVDPKLPATYGGTGWRSRQAAHAQDVQDGLIWRRCGSRSEVGALREIVLAWPATDLFHSGDPNAFLFLQWPDATRLQAQAAAIGAFYESQGVVVHWVKSPGAPPNILFQRDLFFMTPEGAVVARPGAAPRAGEARITAATLAGLGVPIIGTPTGNATFEGADILWLDPDTVLIGVGDRTNAAGAAYLTRLVADLGVDAITVALPKGVQHLLGVVDFIDHDLAAVRADKVTDEILGILHDGHVETIPCGPGADVSDGLGMNFVTLAPRRVIMPASCPSVRQRLTDAGVAVHELDISEYVKAAGGFACLTGILYREH